MKNKRSLLYVQTIIFFLVTACNIPKMQTAVSETLKEDADKMVVNGITQNGRVKRELSFGNYRTSKVKRGWLLTSSRQDRNTDVTTEERILRAFNIDNRSFTANQRDKFSFTITDGIYNAKVFAFERKIVEETRIDNESRWFSEISIGKNFQYSFSAAILNDSNTSTTPWNLLIYSSHKYKSREKLFDMQLPDIQEEGILTNKADTIFVKLLLNQTFVNEKGEESKFLFPIPSAYELRMSGKLIGLIDTWGKVIWMNNLLNKELKLVIAASSSAIFFRRISEKVGMG